MHQSSVVVVVPPQPPTVASWMHANVCQFMDILPPRGGETILCYHHTHRRFTPCFASMESMVFPPQHTESYEHCQAPSLPPPLPVSTIGQNIAVGGETPFSPPHRNTCHHTSELQGLEVLQHNKDSEDGKSARFVYLESPFRFAITFEVYCQHGIKTPHSICAYHLQHHPPLACAYNPPAVRSPEHSLRRLPAVPARAPISQCNRLQISMHSTEYPVNHDFGVHDNAIASRFVACFACLPA